MKKDPHLRRVLFHMMYFQINTVFNPRRFSSYLLDCRMFFLILILILISSENLRINNSK